VSRTQYPYDNSTGPTVIGDVAAALAAGGALGEPRTPMELPDPAGGQPGVYTVVPKDYKVEDLEPFLPRPLRIDQDVTLQDTDSFIGYVKEFMTGATLIFFDVQTEIFKAAFEYHEIGKPSWNEHTASFKPRRSVEFQTWMDSNRKQMTQVEFARFLEENLPDIVEPPAAELLQIALTFEAKKSVEFSSGVRLANGQIQFQYDEVVRGTAQKGTIEIPEKFVLGIPIHVNGPAYRIDVRLRWRLQEGKVVFWYEVVRPHRFIEHALKEISQRIANETGVPLLAGSMDE
jgi:uncharacterized protein YfdQ (DUF2303 family)